MRPTGIIRRMDDLGRVVIPKEIRLALSLKEGEPLEIYTDVDMVCFKKINTKITETAEELEKIYNAKEKYLNANQKVAFEKLLKILDE